MECLIRLQKVYVGGCNFSFGQLNDAHQATSQPIDSTTSMDPAVSRESYKRVAMREDATFEYGLMDAFTPIRPVGLYL